MGEQDYVGEDIDLDLIVEHVDKGLTAPLRAGA